MDREEPTGSLVLRAFVIDDWGHESNLSATQKGGLLGVGLWPFAISIVLLGLFIDRLGYRPALWGAMGTVGCFSLVVFAALGSGDDGVDGGLTSPLASARAKVPMSRGQ